jgi:tetratricopeptide (TPR) repeat protein
LPALAGVSADRIGHWVRARLIEPVDSVQGIARFEFRQIAALKRLDELSRAGVTATRLRRSLRQLAAWLPEAVASLERMRLLDCRQLVMRADDGTLVEPSGQRLFDFAEVTEPAAPLPFDAPIDSDRLLENALELEDAGRFAEAEAAYRRWLLHFGPDAQVCFNLGNVLFSLGQRESAIERFRQAIEIDPDFVEAWGNLGSVLSEIGNHGEALAATRRALELNPAHSAATYNLAHSLQESGSSHEARAVWQRYLRCDSDSPWADYARQCLKNRI